jgi:two-component system response regulator NreC
MSTSKSHGRRVVTKKIRVLIVDDHAVVRAGIRLLLDSQPDMKVVGEAQDGRESLTQAQKVKPDVILMDIAMPDMGGVEATQSIKEAYPQAQILALTMHEDTAHFFRMLQVGASGYVIKGADPGELLNAVRAVFQNKAYLFPSLTRKLVDDYLERLEVGEERDSYAKLTAREREVLKLIGEGYTSREIAEMLFLSINTVERHRTNIMDKLGMHNKSQLIRFAIRKGLVKLED